MNYEEFTQQLTEEVRRLSRKDAVVRVDTIISNNAVKRDCITIRKPADKVTPTIYLESFYEDWQNGRDITDIARDVIRTDIDGRHEFSFKIEDLFDLEKIRTHIVYKLVNTKRNEMMLDVLPHREFLDFSVVYYCHFENKEGASAASVIYNGHMKTWNLTEAELFEIAQANTRRILPPVISDMNDLLVELMGYTNSEEDLAGLQAEIDAYEGINMYVLTNERKIYGASCILYDDILRDFAKEYGSFYILPSSVHEVIFVPESCYVETGTLCQMVEDVNNCEVQASEKLSDNVYYYNKELGMISIVNRLQTAHC